MFINYLNETSLRIRYGETDQMGYVYYGTYAQFFEVGRVEAMRALGLSYRELEEKGYMLPVMDMNIKYFNPATFDDLITIKTNVVSLDGVKLTFNYLIVKDQIKLCEGSTTLVFVDRKTMKPTRPPKFFIERLSEINKN